MDVDNFKPTFVHTIYISSTPERVWDALTSAEFSRKYFSGLAVETELATGGAFVVRMPDGSIHIKGEVIECDPPRKLTITWNVTVAASLSSRVNVVDSLVVFQYSSIGTVPPHLVGILIDSHGLTDTRAAHYAIPR